MTVNSSHVPDDLTPTAELANIISFAGVVIALPSTGSMARDYAESIIQAAERVKVAIVAERARRIGIPTEVLP